MKYRPGGSEYILMAQYALEVVCKRDQQLLIPPLLFGLYLAHQGGREAQRPRCPAGLSSGPRRAVCQRRGPCPAQATVVEAGIGRRRKEQPPQTTCGEPRGGLHPTTCAP
jgi:hypothetical protein